MAYKDALVTRNGPTINRARQVGRSVLVLFQALRYPVACSRRPNPSRLSTRPTLPPPSPSHCDISAASASTTREIMAEIVAARLVDHLERAGFVAMKRPAGVGAAALRRGFEG